MRSWIIAFCLVFAGQSSVLADVPTTVTFHYQPRPGDLREWHIWVWEPGQSGIEYQFDSSDGYGPKVTITYDHAVNQLGFIIMLDTVSWIKDVPGDRFVDLADSSTEVWLLGGQPQTYLRESDVGKTSANFQPSWIRDAVIYEVNVRQFSSAGDFNGVTAQLPRLKALGVDILWLMPIFPIGLENRKGTLGSPYSVASYSDVNPQLGTVADFNKLVKSAHAQGMHVILDWVANHSAWDNPWVAAHPDWYTQDGQGNIVPPNSDWVDVADLNYSNIDMQNAMIAAMKTWVENRNVDGFRADAAGMVPTSFWNRASSELNAIKPLYWLAEDWGNVDLLSLSFLSNYDGSLTSYMESIKQGGANKASFGNQISRRNSWYPRGAIPMTYITNHDLNATATEMSRMGSGLNQSAALSFVSSGIPMIYNGQEICYNHRLAFFERDPIPWTTSNCTDFYKKLIRLKTLNAALWNGSFGGSMELLTTSNPKVVAFKRTKGNSSVIMVMNISSSSQTSQVSTGLSSKRHYIKFSTNSSVITGASMSQSLSPYGFEIYSTAGSG